MVDINDDTPLVMLTLGQFINILEKRISKKKPKKKEKVKEDRIKIDGVHELTGLSYSEIYKLTSKNAIPHRKFGKRLIFSRKEVEQWMNKQTKKK